MKFPHAKRLLQAALFAPVAAAGATIYTLGPNPDGEALTFTDQQGPCVGKALVVIWSKPGASPVPGCYRIEDGVVFVAFLDGDHMRPIPASALVKASGA